MNLIQTNLDHLRENIEKALILYQRKPGSVKLLAVSKGQSFTAMQAAVAAGQFCFGENYLQEALPKMQLLGKENIEWHFIGRIQSNKTKLIAENFNWVQSVSQFKIAERLNEQRSQQLPPLNICIGVNVSGESTKSGVPLNELLELALAIKPLSNLRLRGLMTIPAPEKEFAQQRIHYKNLRHAFENLNAHGFELDVLSMGMTQDFAAAIAEGSTLLRIGTGIFGTRKNNNE